MEVTHKESMLDLPTLFKFRISTQSYCKKKRVYLHWPQLLILERIDLFFLCSTHDAECDTQFLLGLKYEQKCSQNVLEKKKEFWLKTSYKKSWRNLVLFSNSIKMFIFQAVLVFLLWKSLNSIIGNIVIYIWNHFGNPNWQKKSVVIRYF